MRKWNVDLDAPSCPAKEGQNGQVLAMVAVLLIGLLAMAALVLDGGNVYLQRRQMQNAADAGALAGTRILCGGLTAEEAVAEAQAYAAANGAHISQVTVNTNGVTVVATKDVAMTFARLIGLWWVPVSGRASAECKPLNTWDKLSPLGIELGAFQPDQCYSIWDSVEDIEGISGSERGWLNISCYNVDAPAGCDGTDAQKLKDWMANGYPGVVEIPSYVWGSNGVKDAVTMQAYVGELLRVPVYDLITENGYYHLVALGLFRVDAVDFTGSTKGISGCFVDWVGPGKPGDTPDKGVRTYRLTE